MKYCWEKTHTGHTLGVIFALASIYTSVHKLASCMRKEKKELLREEVCERKRTETRGKGGE